MATDAEQIRDRFLAERDYIQRYIDFVISASDIPEHVIYEINRKLQNHSLSELPERPHDSLGFHYSATELDALVSAIDAVTPAINETTERLKSESAPFERTDFDDPYEVQLLSEWEGWMIQHLPDNPSPNDTNKIVKYAISQALHQTDSEVMPETLQEIIGEAARVAVRIKAESRIAGLEVVVEQFDTLCLVARAAMPSAEINIIRQGFILLMTAFDAAVFDLMRLALWQRFFELIGKFGKSEKVSLEQIGSFSNFGSLRDQIIEDQLRVRYVKDLLCVLDSFGVKCVDPSKCETFANLIELVLRRNVHIHNRGIVDDRYLDKAQNGSERFNVHKLAIGQVAVIDSDYWELATRLTTDCVVAVAEWADN